MKYYNIELQVPGIINNISDLQSGSVPIVKFKTKIMYTFFEINPIFVIKNELLSNFKLSCFTGFKVAEVMVMMGNKEIKEYQRLLINGVHLSDSMFMGKNNNLVVCENIVKALNSTGENFDISEYNQENSPKDELKLRMEKMRQLMKVKYPNKNPIQLFIAQQADASDLVTNAILLRRQPAKMICHGPMILDVGQEMYPKLKI